MWRLAAKKQVTLMEISFANFNRFQLHRSVTLKYLYIKPIHTMSMHQSYS